jgi:hypothetical protein
LLEAEEEEENLVKKESFMRYPQPHNSSSFFNPQKRKKKRKPLDYSSRRLFAEKSFWRRESWERNNKNTSLGVECNPLIAN